MHEVTNFVELYAFWLMILMSRPEAWVRLRLFHLLSVSFLYLLYPPFTHWRHPVGHLFFSFFSLLRLSQAGQRAKSKAAHHCSRSGFVQIESAWAEEIGSGRQFWRV